MNASDKSNTQSFNDGLAAACQACHSACCKKGKIFLPPDELAAMRAAAKLQSPDFVAEFESRLSEGPDYALYDQRDGCQFLTTDNLCSLHDKGMKPRECFWWPYHVYINESGVPSIEVSTTCCEAWRKHDDEGARRFLNDIDEQVNGLGVEVITDFRGAYSGSYGRIPIRPVNILKWDFLPVGRLSSYRAVGERFFPQANWDLGMDRYAKMLQVWPHSQRKGSGRVLLLILDVTPVVIGKPTIHGT